MIKFELKNTMQASIKIADITTTIVTQGFTTGVVGVPNSYGMVAGDTIEVVINTNNGTKDQNQMNAEVISAVNSFIAKKYPPIP